METSRRRLAVVAGQFDTRHAGHGATRPDILSLQKLLDHDNHDLRQRMKDFFNQDLYIPRLARPGRQSIVLIMMGHHVSGCSFDLRWHMCCDVQLLIYDNADMTWICGTAGNWLCSGLPSSVAVGFFR